LLISRYIFDGSSKILFYYIKKDALQEPFVNFSVVFNHFTYKIVILGNRLWDASSKGLFYISLSTLPGISSVDPSPLATLQIQFSLFNAKCDNKKALLTWKTAQEQNTSHFDIEKSEDGSHWTVISTLPAAGNSNSERSYSFIDNSPVQNSYYRIAEHDLNGRSQFTSILQSSCNTTNTFSLWPNPVHDRTFINITADNISPIMIKIFDGKGALVKIQRAMVLQGSNQFSVDMKSLSSGVYSVSIDWNNGLMKKNVQVLKQ
jgi:Secretion system C-terminal sorting domain